jgi:hypothetical protein
MRAARFRLKARRARPFALAMSPVSGSSMVAGAAYDVAVAKKALANTKEQGEQALALIQAAAAPPAPAASASIGTLVDVRA